MYSESQFECYRALGEYVVEQITGGKNELDIESFVLQVHKYLRLKVPSELRNGIDKKSSHK